MPLLMCPNCNTSMQSVRRHDVELDMCPQCRGIWMDRGELEKVLEMEREAGSGDAGYAPGEDYSRGPWSGGEKHGGKHGGGHGGGHGYGGYRKRRSIFDIFD